MNEQALKWLLEDNHPAVQYRARTELMMERADKAPVAAWLNRFLPADWATRRGLWFTYYLSAFAQCGLEFEDLGIDKAAVIGFGAENPFSAGCGDFMHLSALVQLGLGNEPEVRAIINALPDCQLPDGGFVCRRRLEKLKHVPKGCVKANLHALLFCARCHNKGIESKISPLLLEYFWNHRLFYRTDNPEKLMLDAREGWRSIDTFHPFEVMRVGLHSIVEAFCALGYGHDARLAEAMALMDSKRDGQGRYLLNGTLSKSYLPKQNAGKPDKWVTFFALLAHSQCR